jgi:hypothetical protein
MPIFSPAATENDSVRRSAAAGIGERHVVELDGRGQQRAAEAGGSGRHQRFGFEQRGDPRRRRLPDHALVQNRAQVAQRAEDLGAGHQHDEQRGDAHLAMRDAPYAEPERERRAAGDADIGDAARHDACR